MDFHDESVALEFAGVRMRPEGMEEEELGVFHGPRYSDCAGTERKGLRAASQPRIRGSANARLTICPVCVAFAWDGGPKPM